MEMLLLISTLLLIVISIPLYMGKISNIIAGYNTTSFKEKEKYSELKLCRILAITLSVTALILVLGSIGTLSINDILIICIVILIVINILSNIISKNTIKQCV